MSQNGSAPPSTRRDAFSALRGLVRERAPREQCEVCSAEIAKEHAHLFEPTARQVICVCDECAVSVGNQSPKYRRVPQRTRYLADFQLSDGQWDSLMIPVGMAFFFYNTPAQQTLAFYPSTMGVTESLLELETWQEIVADNPVLKVMQSDVEALLVNRLKSAREYYIVPIDKCYELAGLIRLHWRGFSGGSEVWTAINDFYCDLKARSETTVRDVHA